MSPGCQLGCAADKGRGLQVRRVVRLDSVCVPACSASGTSGATGAWGVRAYNKRYEGELEEM